MAKLREASPNPHIKAYRNLSYHPRKVYKAWAGIFFTAWVPTATIMAPGGWRRQNLGFWVDWRHRIREKRVIILALKHSATLGITQRRYTKLGRRFPSLLGPQGRLLCLLGVKKMFFLAITKHEEIPRATNAQQSSITMVTTHRIPLDMFP